MMKSSTRSLLRNISRLFYTGGTVLLLVGLLLSMVSQPVKADAPGPVSKDLRPGSGASVPQPTQDQVSDKPAEGPIKVNIPRREPAQVPQSPSANRLPPKNAPAVLPDGSTISFDGSDYSICQYAAGPITVTGTYSIPMDPNNPNREYILETSYYIVNPPDLKTEPNYFPPATIPDGFGTFSVTGDWPGVRPGDTVVEIHFGATLRDPLDDTILPTGTGRDIYWYPWVCSDPTATPTATNTPTATATNTATATPTDTPTATATNTATATPTDTPTATATNTATSTPTDTPTATSTATATPTDTPTATATNTATATPTGTLTATATNTATPTSTLPTPPGGGTDTPTPTATVTSTLPTPPGGGGTNTPTPTQPGGNQPTVTPGGGVIIPETGADLPGFNGLAGMMINLGLLFLGLGLIMTGLSRPTTSR